MGFPYSYVALDQHVTLVTTKLKNDRKALWYHLEMMFNGFLRKPALSNTWMNVTQLKGINEVNPRRSEYDCKLDIFFQIYFVITDFD